MHTCGPVLLQEDDIKNQRTRQQEQETVPGGGLRS